MVQYVILYYYLYVIYTNAFLENLDKNKYGMVTIMISQYNRYYSIIILLLLCIEGNNKITIEKFISFIKRFKI